MTNKIKQHGMIALTEWEQATDKNIHPIDTYQKAKEVEYWFKQSVLKKQESSDVDINAETNSEKDERFALPPSSFLSRVIDYIEAWEHPVHIHDLKNMLLDLSRVLKIEEELSDETLKSWLLKASDVVQIMPDIFAMRNWPKPKHEEYIEQLVFLFHRKVIEILMSIKRPVPFEEMLVKIIETPEAQYWLGNPNRNQNLLKCLLEMCLGEDLALSQNKLSRSHKSFYLCSWKPLPENKSPIVTTAKEIEEQHQKEIEAAVTFAINTIGEFRYPMHIKDLNEIVKDYANTHKLIGYNEQILRRWLKARNQVEEILPDIVALREWSYQRKKWYFTRLIKYVNLQAIDILKEHDNSITVQELILKILNGKGFKIEKGRYTSYQKQPNLIEYILMHHITNPLILSNGKFSLGKTSEEPTEDKRQPKNDTKTTIDEKLIKQAQLYDNKSVLKEGTYVIHSSLGIGLISAVLSPQRRLQYEINFESGKVKVVAESIRLKVIPDSHTISQIEDTQPQFESPNLIMSDEITPQQQIITETQKPEIISESLPAIEQTQPEKDSRYDDELEKFRRGLDNIEFYQDSEQGETTYRDVQEIDSWLQERASK